MPRKLRISVPEPCTQKWDEMSFVDGQQRHCLSCNKLIFDFTKMSDAELIEYFNRNTVSCGKFATHQLNRTIYPSPAAHRKWSTAFLFTAIFSITDLFAQTKSPVQEEVIALHDSAKVYFELPITALPVLGDTLTVQGYVLEKNDSLGQSPLAGAVVLLYLKEGTKGCVSDSEGKFEIRLDSSYAGDSVDVSVAFIGYETYHTTIVLMKEVLLPPVVIRTDRYFAHVVGELPVHSVRRSPLRNFWWRLFHPRHWFHR